MNSRIKRIAKAILNDAHFDRHANRQANPELNTDRKTVGAAYLVQLYDAVHDVPKPTRLPLSLDQIKRRKDKDGFIKIVFPFELSDLMTVKDFVNEFISAAVSGGDDTLLESVTYKPLVVDASGHILIEVTGNVNDWLKEQEHPETVSQDGGIGDYGRPY